MKTDEKKMDVYVAVNARGKMMVAYDDVSLDNTWRFSLNTSDTKLYAHVRTGLLDEKKIFLVNVGDDLVKQINNFKITETIFVRKSSEDSLQGSVSLPIRVI